MSHAGKAVLVCLLAAAAAPLAAQVPAQQQAPDPQAGDPVVVTGMRPQAKNKAVDGFVRATTEGSATSPLTFYAKGDYCPAAVGLSPRLNAAIAARMFQVARAAGVQPGDEGGCQPSALVIFADDPQATIARFRKLHPEYFQALTGEEIEYHGMDGPHAGWKLLARMDRDGNPLQIDSQGVQYVSSNVGLSRAQSMTRLVTAMSVLVIAKEAVRGLTVQQIADFALMRSLVDQPPNGAGGGAPSILSVVDTAMGESTPMSLTAWDLAYIKARYALNPFTYGVRQVATLRRRMKDSLKATDLADSD